MKREIIILLVFFCVARLAPAQQAFIDSLRQETLVTSNDTIRLVLFGKIANVFSEINPDSAYYYGDKCLALARQLHLPLEEVQALGEMGYALLNLGNYPRSLQTLLAALAIVEKPVSGNRILPASFLSLDEFDNRHVTPTMQRFAKKSRILQFGAILYSNAGNFGKAMEYCQEAIPLAEQSNNPRLLCIIYLTKGRNLLSMKQADSALYCLQKANEYASQADYKHYLGSVFLNMGKVYMAMGKPGAARNYYNQALIASRDFDYLRGVAATHLALADYFHPYGMADSVLNHIRTGLQTAYHLGAPDLLLRYYTALADFYNKEGNNDSTVKYQSFIIKINDSLFNSKQAQQFQNIDFNAQQQQQEIQAAKKEYQDRVQKYLLLVGLAVFLAAVIFLWRNNRQRKKSNALLKKQNEEINSAMARLEKTQSLLVQSEKMASLGELTAGIAHEIQNPLNFVNNFSDVNTELIDEMLVEMEGGKIREATAIANSIRENEEKINFHGRRADGIVKSMLQHSRSSSGKKEPVDLNGLIEEYLRLAYHGLRAKEKSFQAKLVTNFDPSVREVNLVPQEIGRVILNLINNAFYAVNERKKMNKTGYEPTVTVTTHQQGDSVGIKVKDNGIGIPQKVIDKIFQPFFTTKAAGQGTGLGLSLSYDIVKAHGGEIKAETKEGEGSEFTVRLPVN